MRHYFASSRLVTEVAWPDNSPTLTSSSGSLLMLIVGLCASGLPSDDIAESVLSTLETASPVGKSLCWFNVLLSPSVTSDLSCEEDSISILVSFKASD